MLNQRLYFTLSFIFYTLFASGQLYYSSYNSISKYEDGEQNLILLFDDFPDFSQFCINHNSGEIYISGYESPVYDFEGRQIHDSNISYDIYSNQSNSMVLDERNSIIYSTRGTLLEAHYIDEDFGQNETIITGTDIHGIAIDTLNDELYYSDRGTNRIYKVNLDGSGNEEVIYLPSGLADPKGLTIDVQREKIYWANTGQKKIQRANLDGTGIENVVLGFDSPENISLNIEENIIYITDVELGAIFSYSLDSEILDTLYSKDTSIPSSIEYNSETRNLFWIDEAQNTGYRLNVDTKENSSIFVGVNGFEFSFAVDELQEIIFVGAENGIFKFNADGSFGEKIYNFGASGSSDIALDLLKEEVYFSVYNQSIYLLDYVGDSISTIYTSDAYVAVESLQFDGANNTLYFLEDGNIFKHVNNGSNFSKELFFDYTDYITLFTLDYINSKIYFKSDDLVYISNFDGSGIEPILGTIVNHLVADPTSEQLFFSNNLGIFTSELNGYYEEQYLESGFVKEFTFGSTDGYLVLPTISTDALANQNTIALSWQVASDFNGLLPSNIVLGNFEIEKRNGFGEFENIGFVEYTLGNTNYSFEDLNPLEGENEYRLKFISDINGLTSYSKYFSTNFVITSTTEINKRNELYFSFNEQKFINNGISGELSIYDIDGQKRKQIRFDTMDKVIDLSDLTKGIYIFYINSKLAEEQNGRFIKM